MSRRANGLKEPIFRGTVPAPFVWNLTRPIVGEGACMSSTEHVEIGDGDPIVPEPASSPLSTDIQLLGWANLLNEIANEMVVPLLPCFLMTVLRGNRFCLGLIESVADSASSVLGLWCGGWSDRRGGSSGFVIFGYALAAIARPLMGVSAAPWQLFIARGSDRVGEGLRASMGDTYVADSSSPESRGFAFGFQRAMDHLGAAVGPILAAGFLWYWPNQFRGLFLLTLVPGLLAVGLLLFGLKRKPSHDVKCAESDSIPLKSFGGNFRLYLLALMLFTLGNPSDSFLLVRASELGVSAGALPLLWCACHLVKCGSNLLAGHAVNRFGSRPIILVGWIMYALVYLVFAYASNAWQAWSSVLGYGLFYAFTVSAEKTLVAQLAGEQQMGAAYGWYNFAIGIGSLPSSLIFGWLYDAFGPSVAFRWGAGLALVASLFLFAPGIEPECPLVIQSPESIL